MKNNQYTATPNWFDKVQQTDDSVSTGNTYVTNFGSIQQQSGLTDLVIEITGEEDGNGLSPEVSWNKEESKLSFVKTKFLKEGDPVVDADCVTTIADNPQVILSNKDFINGLSINKHRFFEKDGILYLDGNLALTGGLVIYADNPESGGDPDPGFGGGTILDISITGEGNVLSDVSLSEDKTILQFVKTNLDFSGNYVDFTSDQDISGVKNFTNGIKINGSRIYKDNGVIYLDGDLAVTGGITTFATAGKNISTIMDGIVADEVTITVAEKDGIKQLQLKEGVGGGLTSAIITGTGNAVTDASLEDEGKTLNLKKDKTFLIPNDLLDYAKEDWVTNQLQNYVTLNTEQDITAIKNFLEGITIGSSKKKFYEKDGVVYIDANLAVTGGITQYAVDPANVSDLMDNIRTDGTTICVNPDTKELEVIGGIGIDLSAMWDALSASTSEQINRSHLTTALQGYATESWANSNFLGKTDKAVDSDKINGEHNGNLTSRYWNPASLLDDLNNYKHNGFAAWHSGSANTPYGYGTLFQFSNQDNPIAGTNGHWVNQLAYGTNNRLYVRQRINNTNSWTSWSSVAYLTDNVASATKLQTPRTIWGQSFDGTKNISGAFTSVTDITGTGTFTGANIKATDSVYVNGIRLYKSADNTLKIEGNLLVTGGITQYSTEESGGGSGGGGIDVDALWEILGGTGTQQINKSHLTDALKGYLTSVSLSTISDLHSSWNALLKAAPSGYVTRWPTISEVTNKQSLVVKLNSGTTEGTNMFTYNATTAKSINITPSAIGAAASSHNHSWANITSGKPNSLAGYGITDAYTKTESDGKYPIKTGGGASGTWGINISGTAANANKLQNLTWSDFFSRRYYYLDYGAQSTSNFYPIFFFPSDIELDCEIHSDNVSGTNAYNQNRIHFQLTAQGWTDAGVSFRILSRNNYTDSEITIGAIGYGAKDGGIAIWVRGGKRYKLYCNRAPNMKTSDFTYGSGEKYTVGPNLWGGNNETVSIVWKNDSTRNNGVVATVDGNVYSATKLQNTRTIFGQNFNGEQNVNGVITSSISTNNLWNCIVKLSDTSLSDGNAIYLGIGHSASAKNNGYVGFCYYGSGDNRNILTFGLNGVNKVLNINGAGNIGIGTITPSYKLDVKGDIKADGWVRTSGNQGWYAQDWGGGWYMQDSNWIRAFNDKSVYTNGAMQAGKLVTTSSGIDITYGNNNEFIRVGYNESDGDFVTFKVPGNNNQSKWMKLSSSKGLYISGILEATWDINGRSFEANYGSNSGELNTNLSSFYDKATPVIPHDGYRYLLGWQDNCPQGYTTGYAIGSYRTNINWGSMLFEVCNYEGSRSRLTQMELRGKDNTLWLSGNILAIGGITQYSDQRAKTIIEQITLSLQSIANSPVVRFRWNGWKQKDDGKTHIGGIAQYVQNVLPEVIYNSDDVLTMDYATTGYIFAVNTAKHLLDYETKTDKEIKKLKKRIKYLEKQLKKLGYEEANIMDN